MTSKQKRKKRRRKRNHLGNPHELAKERQRFCNAWLEAHREQEHQAQIETDLNQSTALLSAQADEKRECTVYVTNIPFKVTAKDLATCLNGHLIISTRNRPQPLLISCEILKQKKQGPYKGTSSGKTILVLASKDAFNCLQRLCQTSGLVLQGRQIKILKGYKPQSHRDHLNSKPFVLS